MRNLRAFVRTAILHEMIDIFSLNNCQNMLSPSLAGANILLRRITLMTMLTKIRKTPEVANLRQREHWRHRSFDMRY